jgi:HAD superfamily hydrolase (TIGR01450 family)
VNSAALVQAYDAVLLDLDGVVYLGPVAVPGAADAVAALRDGGVRVGFVTNNAARPPAAVAAHLVELGIPATPDDVVTSAQAAAQLLRARFGPAARVLVVGGAGVRDALTEAGLTPVDSADDDPVGVMQGWGMELTWNQLNEAAVAVHRGAHWVATNTDPTRPTDRGLVPGNGAAVAAVRLAVDRDPEVAGKPYRPLMVETVHRLGARRPVFVGDRLDTDIAGARRAGLAGMLVLTGSHGPVDLLAATAEERPNHLGLDLGDLLRPAREARLNGRRAQCGDQAAEIVGGRVRLGSPPRDRDSAVDALWAAAQLVWAARDAGESPDVSAMLAAVEPVLSGDAVD